MAVISSGYVLQWIMPLGDAYMMGSLVTGFGILKVIKPTILSH